MHGRLRAPGACELQPYVYEVAALRSYTCELQPYV